MKMQNVMVIVAHPDDEVLGCGGFIQNLVKAGSSVYVLYANAGYVLRKYTSGSVDDVKNQIDNVNGYLKTSGYVLGQFTAGEMDTYPIRELVDFISEQLKAYNIDTVITHADTDLHQDHIAVNKACMVCCRFKYQTKIKTVLTFATISSSDISPITSIDFNYYVEINKQTLQRKISCMEFYTHELLSMPKNRGPKPITVWAEFLGLQSGVRYAEGFKLIRSIQKI